MFDALFLHHPRSIGETYSEHFATAVGVGFSLIGAGLACVVHAIVPALFERTASTAVNALHSRLANRARIAVREQAIDYAI